MQIDPLASLKLFSGDITEKTDTGKADEATFSSLIQDRLKETEELGQQADQAAQQVATGEIQDVHTAMIAAQKAEISLQYTMAIRNKLIEAYQEIMRMQV